MKPAYIVQSKKSVRTETHTDPSASSSLYPRALKYIKISSFVLLFNRQKNKIKMTSTSISSVASEPEHNTKSRELEEERTQLKQELPTMRIPELRLHQSLSWKKSLLLPERKMKMSSLIWTFFFTKNGFSFFIYFWIKCECLLVFFSGRPSCIDLIKKGVSGKREELELWSF